MTAEIISVGTELLLGNILNTNAQYLSRELAALGITVQRESTIGDNHSRLADFVNEAKQRCDLLVFTGGLGPTADDQGVATAYRCTAEVTFSDYCPCMVVDKPLAQNALTYMTELLGRGAMDMTLLTGGKPGGGSEDFAFVSHEVPTVSMFLSAGNAKEGYLYGQHHPKVRFDDSVLYEGSAAYTYMALRWLADHKE